MDDARAGFRNRRSLLLGAAAGICPLLLPPDARAQQPSTTVVHLTAPAGIGEYEWALTHDRILAKQSKWLRKRSQPTQSPRPFATMRVPLSLEVAMNWPRFSRRMT